MLRSAAIPGVIALCCVGLAPSAEAQSHGSLGGPRVQSLRVEQGSAVFQHHRFIVDHRFRDRFLFRNRFPFDSGFGFPSDFGGYAYYPYDTAGDYGNYPYAGAVPPQGPGAGAALPPPWMRVADRDRPPCRETAPDGVVVLRGMACERGKP